MGETSPPFLLFERNSVTAFDFAGSNLVKKKITCFCWSFAMLTAKQAQELIGVGAGQLLLLALTRQIPSRQDPESRLVLFERSNLMEWSQTHRTAFSH